MSEEDMAKPLSGQLEAWLSSHRPKTLYDLNEVFGEKSFAVIILLLMAIPALPIPTGGITHIFEIITVLLILELLVGMKKVWLPKRWKHMKLPKAVRNKVMPALLKRIKWFEARSNPRWQMIFHKELTFRMIWAAALAFTVLAFFSPPFSGLDTLPALGVVFICLSIILDDAVILAAGLGVGSLGVFLVIGLGTAITTFIKHIL